MKCKEDLKQLKVDISESKFTYEDIETFAVHHAFQLPGQLYARGRCRTGRCHYQAIVVGGVSANEQHRDLAHRALFNYTLPFDNARTSAERFARSPLQCTPFGSRLPSTALGDRDCKAGRRGNLLDPASWLAYHGMLGDIAMPPLAHILAVETASSPGSAAVSPGGRNSFRAFAAAAADAAADAAAKLGVATDK